MNPTQVIKIKLTHPNAKMPTKGSSHAACWDVYAAEITRIRQDWYEVNLGFQLEPPPGYKVVLVPRSSITKTNLIQQNSPGQGDGDYRGEYKFVFKILPNSAQYEVLRYPRFPYLIGDRVGQIFLEKVIPLQFEQVDELSETSRGEGGFGSTGK